MTRTRLQIGRCGENEALNYLRNEGYQILETNYRCRLGEIDIIARDDNRVVIIEVRTKTGSAHGLPEESLTGNKTWRLKQLALHYLQVNRKLDLPCRIDLIAVMINKKDHTLLNLKHIKGILAG